MNSTTLSSEVISVIKDVGLYIYPELVEKRVVEKLKEQTLGILSDRGDTDYKFGTSVNMGGLNEQCGAIREFFDTNYFNGLAIQYGTLSARAVMATHDYRNDQGTERNGFLHFDRTHTFKFFLYLTDCDESSGAFRYVPDSRELGETLRTQATVDAGGDYKTIANRLEIDYLDLNYTAEDAKPLEGKAGTLFAFDTDTFHMGGVTQDGKERVVIRSHYV
tara:strand:- start:2289 stop:2945 length:657 start_codon:yes stop_codon:yes gene_type:complete